MDTPAWGCNPIPPGEPGVDPIQQQFFVPEGASDSLVREVIQNSLDARRDEEPVRVRFFLSGETAALPPDEGSRYFAGLWPHLGAVRLPNRPDPATPVNFITIEDFGTRGLRGDPNQEHDAPDVATKNDFYYFWRNWARSEKRAGERGRWGVGKTVFPASSRAHVFFGVTRVAESHHPLLMGEAVLKVHLVGGRRHSPYAFFAERRRDGFPMPITDIGLTAEFSERFHLTRSDALGLSIVVPFYDSESFTPERLIDSCLLHFFQPIISGELEVVVETPDSCVVMTNDTLDEVLTTHLSTRSPESLEPIQRMIALTRWALEAGRHAAWQGLGVAATAAAPNWDAVLPADEEIAPLRDRFLRGERVSVRVPILIRHLDGRDREAAFYAFLEADANLDRAWEYYIRSGLTIPRISKLGSQKIRALLVVEDEALSELLGDAENPSHTDWEERATRLKEKYRWGPTTVRFVKNALKRLAYALSHTAEAYDEELLTDVFSIPEAEAVEHRTRVGRRSGKKGTESAVDAVPELPEPTRYIQVSKTADGFRILPHPRATRVPSAVAVRAAYEVRRGNAFAAYETFDFEFGRRPVRVELKGAKLIAAEGNLLKVDVEGPEFKIEVRGFDVNRDLKVRVIPEAGEE